MEGCGRLAPEVEVWSDAAPEPIDEVLIHVLELVRDVEAHDALAGQLGTELLLQPGDVPLLHNEDQICPSEMACGDANARPFLGAGRPYLMGTRTVEDRLGREAAEPVPAADKLHFHSRGVRCGPTQALTCQGARVIRAAGVERCAPSSGAMIR